MKDHKWVTLDNATGERTLAQHCFIPHEGKKYITREVFISNKSLCGIARVGNENNEVEQWDAVVGENQSTRQCKICKKIFDSKTLHGINT
jgi:hypothetical protein